MHSQWRGLWELRALGKSSKNKTTEETTATAATIEETETKTIVVLEDEEIVTTEVAQEVAAMIGVEEKDVVLEEEAIVTTTIVVMVEIIGEEGIETKTAGSRKPLIVSPTTTETAETSTTRTNGEPSVVVEGEEVVAQAEEEAAFLAIEETGTTWNTKKTSWLLLKARGDVEKEGEARIEAEVILPTSECAWKMVKEQEEVNTTAISSTTTTKATTTATIIMEATPKDLVAIALLHPITAAADFAVVEDEEWGVVGEEVEVVLAVEVLLLLIQVETQTQQALLLQKATEKAAAETKSNQVAARTLAPPVAGM